MQYISEYLMYKLDETVIATFFIGSK